jgi:Flp pilus assembly protein TadG
MVEFALVLPLLLVVMFGLIEVGRLLFIYSVVFTSTREAARYGSAAGFLAGNLYQYQDCDGIRSAAKRVGSLAGIQDDNITVTYDRVTVSGVSPLGSCPVGSTGPRLTLGNRVTVRVSVNYQPLVPVPNLPSFPIISISSRTILKEISIQGTPVASSSTLPTVFFAEEPNPQKNEDTPASWNVVVLLSSAASSPVTVNFSVGGSAIEGSDYTIGETSPLIIPAGNLSASFPITAIPDGVSEFDETIALRIDSSINAVRGSPYILELTIRNDDGLPLVTFQSPGQSIGENYPEIHIPVHVDPVSGLDIEVPYTLTGSATAVSDYDPPPATLIIPAGTTDADIVIRLVDDLVYDPDETLVVTLGTPINANLGAITVHTVTIVDNDGPPVVSFLVASQSASEATGMVLVTAVLRQGSTEVVAGVPVSVNFLVSGTAVSPADYNISPSPLVIPVGSSRGDIVVYLANDGVFEPDETVVITLQDPPSNATLGAPSVHTLTVTSDPTVSFTQASQSVHESTLTADIQVQLVPVQAVDVSVPFAITDGTATQGPDYTVDTSSPLVIPAGQTIGHINLTLVVDGLDELSENVIVALGNPTNAVRGLPDEHTLTILDDDPLPVVTFSAAGQSVEEDAGDVSVQVQLSAASTLPITVPLSLSGSALPGLDFNFNQTSVVIPPGGTGAALSVQVIDDLLRELDETILISMGQPTNANLGTPAAHTITILINDQPTCDIDDSNPLVFDSDGHGVSWTLSNFGTDTLVLSQLTISWPTGAPNAPKFAQVYSNGQLIYNGNHPQSPTTVTSWQGFQPYRELSSTGSTVDLKFTRLLDSGSYALSLIFHNVTRNYDCSLVTSSAVLP